MGFFYDVETGNGKKEKKQEKKGRREMPVSAELSAGDPEGRSDLEKKACFERVVLEQEKRLFLYVYSICRDAELSRDIVQETFIQAHQQFMSGAYEEKGRIAGWLQTIARNKLLGHYRANGRHSEMLALNKGQICENLGWVPEKMEEHIGNRVGGAFDLKPERESRKERIAKNMEVMLETDFRLLVLTDVERKLVCRRHRRQEAFREMAAFLDQPLSTVMSRYYSTMKKIQRQLLDLDSRGVFDKELSLAEMQELIRQLGRKPFRKPLSGKGEEGLP